jgi:four helix bundle protein
MALFLYNYVEVIIMSENIVLLKSKSFAIRIINLYKHLCSEKKEYVISKQLLRSGTSIGANIHEAKYSYSKKEFVSKMSIALKEANETSYWLELIFETEYITKPEFDSINSENQELLKLLTSIVKSSRAQ